MSEDYIKNSCVPEFYVGADYASDNGWLAGAGVHLISLKPRTSSEVDKKVYKVNERMTTYSYEAHLKYTGRNYTFAAKSLMASCLDQTALIGGYGISSVDPRTGNRSILRSGIRQPGLILHMERNGSRVSLWDIPKSGNG